MPPKYVQGMIKIKIYANDLIGHAVAEVKALNQFEEMFKNFLELLDSFEEAERERTDILHRAKVMDCIASWQPNGK